MRVNAVHIGVPRADGELLRYIPCGQPLAFYRRARMDGLPRDATHYMNAEFQPEGVNFIGYRFEALAAG